MRVPGPRRLFRNEPSFEGAPFKNFPDELDELLDDFRSIPVPRSKKDEGKNREDEKKKKEQPEASRLLQKCCSCNVFRPVQRFPARRTDKAAERCEICMFLEEEKRYCSKCGSYKPANTFRDNCARTCNQHTKEKRQPKSSKKMVTQPRGKVQGVRASAEKATSKRHSAMLSRKLIRDDLERSRAHSLDIPRSQNPFEAVPPSDRHSSVSHAPSADADRDVYLAGIMAPFPGVVEGRRASDPPRYSGGTELQRMDPLDFLQFPDDHPHGAAGGISEGPTGSVGYAGGQSHQRDSWSALTSLGENGSGQRSINPSVSQTAPGTSSHAFQRSTVDVDSGSAQQSNNRHFRYSASRPYNISVPSFANDEDDNVRQSMDEPHENNDDTLSTFFVHSMVGCNDNDDGSPARRGILDMDLDDMFPVNAPLPTFQGATTSCSDAPTQPSAAGGSAPKFGDFMSHRGSTGHASVHDKSEPSAAHGMSGPSYHNLTNGPPSMRGFPESSNVTGLVGGPPSFNGSTGPPSMRGFPGPSAVGGISAPPSQHDSTGPQSMRGFPQSSNVNGVFGDPPSFHGSTGHPSFHGTPGPPSMRGFPGSSNANDISGPPAGTSGMHGFAGTSNVNSVFGGSPSPSGFTGPTAMRDMSGSSGPSSFHGYPHATTSVATGPSSFPTSSRSQNVSHTTAPATTSTGWGSFLDECGPPSFTGSAGPPSGSSGPPSVPGVPAANVTGGANVPGTAGRGNEGVGAIDEGMGDGLRMPREGSNGRWEESPREQHHPDNVFRQVQMTAKLLPFDIPGASSNDQQGSRSEDLLLGFFEKSFGEMAKVDAEHSYECSSNGDRAGSTRY